MGLNYARKTRDKAAKAAHKARAHTRNHKRAHANFAKEQDAAKRMAQADPVPDVKKAQSKA